MAKFKAEQQAAQAERERRQREYEQLMKENEALRQPPLAAPAWGSVAARRAETLRVRQQIADNAARRAAEAQAQTESPPVQPAADDPPPG